MKRKDEFHQNVEILLNVCWKRKKMSFMLHKTLREHRITPHKTKIAIGCRACRTQLPNLRYRVLQTGATLPMFWVGVMIIVVFYKSKGGDSAKFLALSPYFQCLSQHKLY